jgi:hypothetical protein
MAVPVAALVELQMCKTRGLLAWGLPDGDVAAGRRSLLATPGVKAIELWRPMPDFAVGREAARHAFRHISIQLEMRQHREIALKLG